MQSLVRKLAASNWTTFAILRVRARRQWLDGAIDRLYADTQLHLTASHSREQSETLRAALGEMEGHLASIAKAIPFDRKLGPVMRPFTHTFQQIIRLHNATRCGMASLSLRLAGPQPIDLETLHHAATDILDARERMSESAPGWADPEMDIYDYV
ncbi:MAG: hypothetical protein U5J83_12330 [Bryobacterales bacterium]|nr:hypothetical protein [Bryobacterales bacterium]